jgi:Flp pilus assembly protein TadD
VSDPAVRRTTAISRATTLLDLHRGPAALNVLITELASAPDDAELLGLAALAHCEIGSSREAERMTRRAIAADPDSPDSWRLLAKVLGDQGRLGEAEEAAVRAVELDPHGWLSLVELAIVQAQVPRRRHLAWGAARQAVERAPDEPDTHWAMGHAALACRDRVTARRAFEHVLTIDPQHGPALNDLGRLRFMSGDSMGAVRGFLRSAATDPHDSAGAKNVDIAFSIFLVQGYLAMIFVGVLVFHLSVAPASTAGRAVISALPLAVAGWSVFRLRRGIGARFLSLLRSWCRRDTQAGIAVVLLSVILMTLACVPWVSQDAPSVAEGMIRGVVVVAVLVAAIRLAPPVAEKIRRRNAGRS